MRIAPRAKRNIQAVVYKGNSTVLLVTTCLLEWFLSCELVSEKPQCVGFYIWASYEGFRVGGVLLGRGLHLGGGHVLEGV